MNVKRTTNGFSLVETLVSLTLIGTLAAVLYPMVTQQSSASKLREISRQGAAELAQAYVEFCIKAQSFPNQDTKAQSIVELGLNYATILKDPSNPKSRITYQIAPNDTPNPLTCSTTSPCAVLQNGGYLMYKSNATFGPAPLQTNINKMHFLFDPDGPGAQPAFDLYLFYGGRVSPEEYGEGTNTVLGLNNDLQKTTKGPKYLQAWLDG